MVVNRKTTIEDLAEFSSLAYQDKVRLFDEMFRLVPFDFPKTDLECSWFTNEVRYNQLAAYLNSENSNKNIYAAIAAREGKDLVFDIRPVSKAHRVFFNQFVVTKFLAAKNDLAKQLSQEVKNATSPTHFLEAKQTQLLAVADWAKAVLREQKFSLRHQFLRIFFNGYLAYQNVNDDWVKVRRRFVELFLHSQGLLLAAHLDEVRSKMQLYKTESGKEPMSLSQKIYLLQELGVIELLRQKFGKRNNPSGKDPLPELIGLICSDKPTNSRLVAKHISALASTAHPEGRSEKHMALVRSELARFGL